MTVNSSVNITLYDRQPLGTAIVGTAFFTGAPTFLSLNGGEPPTPVDEPPMVWLVVVAALSVGVIRAMSETHGTSKTSPTRCTALLVAEGKNQQIEGWAVRSKAQRLAKSGCFSCL